MKCCRRFALPAFCCYTGFLIGRCTESSHRSPDDCSCHRQICIVGRPNVGKSALYNRLVRRKEALVFDTPGSHVTRDYREGTGQLGDLQFRVIDTSGLEPYLPTSTLQVTSQTTAK